MSRRAAVADPEVQEVLRRDRAARLPGALQSMIYNGRAIGKPAGGYISDLVALRKAIVLCWEHANKFDASRAQYFAETNLHVDGDCDDCRQPVHAKGWLFMPLELVEGRNRTWTPRPEARAAPRRHQKAWGFPGVKAALQLVTG